MTTRTRRRRLRRLIISFVTLSLLALAGGFAVKKLFLTRDAAGYLADAQVNVAKGNFPLALAQLRTAAKLEPNSLAVRQQLAIVASRVRDYASAEKEIKIAQEMGLPEEAVSPILAAAYYAQRKYDVLIKTIPEGDRSPETESTIRLLRGLALMDSREDMAAAEASLKSSIELHPDQPRAEIGLVRIDIGRKSYKTAEERLDRVLSGQMPPDSEIDALSIKAWLRRRDLDMETAILFYGKLLDKAPGMVDQRIERAETYLLLMNDDLAVADVDYILQRNGKHATAVYLKALILWRKNDENGAYDLLQRFGSAISLYNPALLLMGQLQIKRNLLESAQSNITVYLQMAPENTEARLLIGNLLLHKNLPDQAILVLKAMPAMAELGDIRVLRLLAQASMQAGRQAEARAWLDKAKAVSPAPGASGQASLERLSFVQANGATVDFYSAIKVDAKAVDPRIAVTLTQLHQGQLDEAQRTATSLLADTPESPIADNLLGGVLVAQGDLAAARRQFDDALRKNYDWLPVRLNIAGLNVAAGNLADAARHYAAIVALSPNNTAATIALADLSLRRQQPAEAESWLAYAAIADLTDVAPRIALVDLYLGRKDQAKAMVAALELQKTAPANPEALDAVGRVQLAAGDSVAAMETYRALVAAAPSMPGAHAGLARALALAGDPNAAMTALRKGLADLPDAAGLAAELSKLLQQAGDSDEALKVARDWQSRHPARAEGDLLLADILEQQSQFREAASSFAAALKKQPSTGTAIGLARTRMAAGNGDAAVAELRQWIQEHPQDKAAQDALNVLLAAKGP